MYDPYIKSSSKHHPLFHKKEESIKINMKLNIWDDDCIERLDENNQKCIWCDNTFQVINNTNDLSHVLGTKGVYTKSCFAAIGTYHPTRYQYLKHLKAARKGVIKDYSENINPYISCLQNK